MLSALLLVASMLSPLPEAAGTLNCRFATFDRTGRQASVVGGPVYEPAAVYVTRMACSFWIDVPTYAGTVIFQDTQGMFGMAGTGGCWADPSGPSAGCNAGPPYVLTWNEATRGHQIGVCTRTASRADLAAGTNRGCSTLATA
jgi:hypothetical protein